MAQKASDRWVLPVHKSAHDAQHRHGDERDWWETQGIDPHLSALVLWGLWNERGDDATDAAISLMKLGLGRI
jgi:hypothetical protein